MRTLVLMMALLATPLLSVAAGPGEPAPPFSAPLLRDSGSLKLDDLRGKVVYLDFWASWCAPCGQSLPWMERLRDEFGGNGLEVVAVNVDEAPADALRFLKRFPVSYPIVADGQGRVAALYDVQDMPTSYLIDRGGTVRHVHSGFNRDDAAALRETVARLLEETP